jgi:hypothetical protein
MIPLTPADRRDDHQRVRHFEAPYRWFIAASLAVGVLGGFMLALLLPLARALEWDWGESWQPLAQAHGQLQLVGFGGLFVMGMAFRLIPRFSGRSLALSRLVVPLIPLVVSGVGLRALALPLSDSAARDGILILSGLLLLTAGVTFAAVILRTLVHPASRAGATGWFLSLGAVAYLAQAVLNFVIVVKVVRDSLALAPTGEDQALIFLQLYGFLLMFLSGIATRAVPTFAGHHRADRGGAIVSILLAGGVAIFAAGSLWVAYGSTSEAAARLEDGGMLITSLAFVGVTWLTGVFRPSANRVAAASQTQFNFVRATFAWMLFAAALSAWFAHRALLDGAFVDSFETDAIRHALTVGVLTMMIIGMAMLVVPEFAGRRLQHQRERWLVLALLAALNVAVALRIWPAIEGVNWLTSDRYWPVAAAGALAETVVGVFAIMFFQSWFEQRAPGWGSTRALTGRLHTRRPPAG